MFKGFILALSSAGLATQLFAGGEKIKVVELANTPPWIFRAADGQLTGIAVEQATRLIREAGFEEEFVELPWQRALDYMKLGQVDMMMILSRTPAREEFIYFVGVMAEEQNMIMVHKDSAGIQLRTLDDLAKGTSMWGIRKDIFYSKEFNSRLERDAEFRSHFDVQAKAFINIDKVRYKRISGMLSEGLSLKYRIKQEVNPPFKILEVPFFPKDPIYIGLSRKLDPAKTQKLQDAFDRLARQNVFQRIVETWVEP